MEILVPPNTIQTLIVMWVLLLLSIIVMALRLLMRKIRRQDFDFSDYVTMGAIFCLTLLISLLHVVVVWKTPNLTEAYLNSFPDINQEIYQAEIGSKLILVTRVVGFSYVWLQKVVVMCLYRRLLFGVHWAEITMKVYWFILAITYVPVQVVTFTECKPFSLYWQVLPEQAVCARGVLQQTVFASLNIFTDVMLIVLPLPIIFKLNRTLMQRVKLIILLSLGALTIAIAIGRLVCIFRIATIYVDGVTFYCVEYFAAAIVANLPALYSLRRPALNSSTGTNSGSKSGSDRPPFKTTASNFHQIKDQGILVTRSIELHDRRAGIPINPHEYLDAWDKQSSSESLVGPGTAF